MNSLKRTAVLLACLLALAGCSSPSVRLVQPIRMQVDPLPPELRQTDTPNLTQRLHAILMTSPTVETKPSVSTPKS